MDTNTTIQLEPKTRKARNRLAELKQAMTWGASDPGPPDWQIIRQQMRVGFDSESGPWLLLRPITGPHIAERFERWVHATQDRDFAVHEV
jgi:hypothetical protein